ncbi:uncharacterized protein CTRU02_205671 [Colletotrichum truncatum]|uniref:Uncharacterized protein n=1 Tax=Colletotrichum truncatum TaxID=5467 RepID=A0ACC3Z4N8_COLTU
MSPVPQEPKSASSTTARPDNESSVDNVAQDPNGAGAFAEGHVDAELLPCWVFQPWPFPHPPSLRPLGLPVFILSSGLRIASLRDCPFRTHPTTSPSFLAHSTPLIAVQAHSLVHSSFPSIGTGAVWTFTCTVWVLVVGSETDDVPRGGEQAATALEANLTSLENRLDALLAAFEAAEESQKETDSVATVQDHKPKRDNTAAAHHGTSSENKVQDGTGSNTAGVTKRP